MRWLSCFFQKRCCRRASPQECRDPLNPTQILGPNQPKTTEGRRRVVVKLTQRAQLSARATSALSSNSKSKPTRSEHGFNWLVCLAPAPRTSTGPAPRTTHHPARKLAHQIPQVQSRCQCSDRMPPELAKTQPGQGTQLTSSTLTGLAPRSGGQQYLAPEPKRLTSVHPLP